jgi:hypothetical protein
MTIQLLTDACTNGLSCLNKRQLLIVWAQSKNTSALTAQQLLAAACTNGLTCLDTKQLLTVIAQAGN